MESAVHNRLFLGTGRLSYGTTRLLLDRCRASYDRKNQSITYTYDQLNRLTQKSYPDTSTVNYTYDLDSRLTQVTDPTGTYSFTFDNMGRLTSATASYAFLTSRSFTTSYTYDAASNRTGMTDPENGSTTYAYDTLNRLQTLTPPTAFTATGNFGFSYDALSRRTQMTRPNSITTNYTYDNLSRLLSVLHQSGATTLDGASYTVDNAGNRTSKTDQRLGVTTNYGYDNIYQLLSATQGANTTESYTYDAVGNRLSSLGVSPYSYNTSNELTSTPSTSYTYDYNGNALTSTTGSNTTSYAWDFENRLTSMTLPGSGGTVSFKYDPLGRRVQKSFTTGANPPTITTSNYAYDGDNLIEEADQNGNVIARYSQTQSIDEPLTMLRSGSTSYYHADGLGSLTSVSNTAGALSQTYTFDSFGNQTASSGSVMNGFRYASREFDAESALYYMRARYFDPATGRFISEDPVTFLGGHNFYNYSGNEPTTFKDPFGLDKTCNVPPIGPHSKLPTPITTCASDSLVDCMIQTESSGNPKAKSKKGATGLMQVTQTAIDALNLHGFDAGNMTNRQIGTTYINLLLTYCSNVSTSLAAYNAGPGAVNTAGGIPKFPETQNYVKKIDACLKKKGLKDGVNDPGAIGGCECK
jgi:RHS repeat-associated protein